MPRLPLLLLLLLICCAAIGACDSPFASEEVTTVTAPSPTTTDRPAVEVPLAQLQESLRRQLQSYADDDRAAGESPAEVEVQRVECEPVRGGESACDLSILSSDGSPIRGLLNGDRVRVAIAPDKTFVATPIGGGGDAQPIRGKVTPSGAPSDG